MALFFLPESIYHRHQPNQLDYSIKLPSPFTVSYYFTMEF
jgi:hypothetical protein